MSDIVCDADNDGNGHSPTSGGPLQLRVRNAMPLELKSGACREFGNPTVARYLLWMMPRCAS